MDIYIMYDRNGKAHRFTREQIIANAAEREAEGEKPRYCYNFGNGDLSPAGYLVVSMYSGCVVAVHWSNGHWSTIKGFQGDFVCC